MLLPLVGVVFAGVPANWLAWPVAADLHPVGWNYGVRYQRVLTETLGGTRASPVFSPVTAAADVHWRLVQDTGYGLPIDADRVASWRDTALAGVFLTGGKILDETVDRSPTLDSLYTAVDTIVNPNLRLTRAPGGSVAVGHRSLARASERIEQAEAELALPAGNHRPSFDVGVAWRLRSYDDPPEVPLLDYGAFLALANVGVSNLRVDLLARAGNWAVTGRQELYPRVYAVASARSVDTSELSERTPWTDRVVPGRWAVGVMWNLPWARNCTLRFDRITSLQDETITWQVTFRSEQGAPAPGRPYPALGARDPADAWLPDVASRSPNGVEPVIASPAWETSLEAL